MTKKLKRKDVKEIGERLGSIAGIVADNGAKLVAMQRELKAHLLSPEMDRIETLLGGVKVALERMGGNVLPSAVQDIHALRDQMAEFRHELSVYSASLQLVVEWVNRTSTPEPAKPRRTYNRHKNDQPKVEISSQDVAPHNGGSEVEVEP